MNKINGSLILALMILSQPLTANPRLAPGQKPKLAKNICWGCKLTEKQQHELKKLIKNYNAALQKYCSWISIVQKQHFINRPAKEALYTTSKYKKQIETCIDKLEQFYISAGIEQKEILELRTQLNHGQQILTCDLAILATN